MKWGDLKEVLSIERTSFPTPWGENMFLMELCRPNTSHFYVAEICLPEMRGRRSRQVVGYGGFWVIQKEAHICSLAVHPQLRRRGYGQRLLAHFLKKAKAMELEEAVLEVRVSNYPARRLYRKFGFKEVGIRKGYYVDNNEDAVVMSLYLREGENEPE